MVVVSTMYHLQLPEQWGSRGLAPLVTALVGCTDEVTTCIAGHAEDHQLWDQLWECRTARARIGLPDPVVPDPARVTSHLDARWICTRILVEYVADQEMLRRVLLLLSRGNQSRTQIHLVPTTSSPAR